MGLGDEIRRQVRQRGGRPYRLDAILGELDEDDAEQLLAAIADTAIPALAIQRALTERHISVSYSTVCKWTEQARDRTESPSNGQVLGVRRDHVREDVDAIRQDDRSSELEPDGKGR